MKLLSLSCYSSRRYNRAFINRFFSEIKISRSLRSSQTVVSRKYSIRVFMLEGKEVEQSKDSKRPTTVPTDRDLRVKHGIGIPKLKRSAVVS